jgi:ATP-dependent RNA helicase RhlE
VICFTRTKHRANRLAAALSAQGISCVPIHGNRTQGQRLAALEGFKGGRFRVLVATDIAARGIDIAEVSHVINFDCPHIAEDYIHRVGRTGRASAVGDAFTFVSNEELSNLRVIERAINKRLPRVTLPDFDYTQKEAERLEIPIAQRLAAIRQQKQQERARHNERQQGERHYPPSNGLPGHGGSPPRGRGRPNKHGKFGRRKGQGGGGHRGPGGPR